MALTVIKQPRALNAVRNPFGYEIQTDNADCKFIVLQIWAESEIYADDFDLLIELESPPDLYGKAYFHFTDGEFLDAILTYPNFDANTYSVQVFRKTTRRLFAKISEYTTSLGVFTDLEHFSVILSAFSFSDFAGSSYFLPKNYQILTTKPMMREAFYGYSDWLFGIAPYDSNFIVSFSISYATGEPNVNWTEDIGFLQRYEIFSLPIGDAQKLYTSRGIGTISHITVGFLDQSIVLFPSSVKNKPRILLYANSLGGFDTLTALGEHSTGRDGEFQTFKTYLPPNYSVQNGEYSAYANKQQPTIKLSTGYKPQGEINAFLDAFSNDRIAYEYLDNQLIPIIIQNKKADSDNSLDEIAKHEIEYRYAFDEKGVRPQ